MKTKIILTLLLLILTNSIKAQEICHYSNFTSYKRLVNDTWTDWTDWREYYVEIVLDTDSNTITIYDEDIVKVYKIHPIYEKSEDCNSTTIKYKVLESTCLYIRFRYQYNGIKQLYLDYKDLVYVYNLM